MDSAVRGAPGNRSPPLHRRPAVGRDEFGWCMAVDGLRYDRMIDTAFRGVVREALRQVSKDGLPGDHHFYLSFRTRAPGVELPENLRSQYPGEMTIVLQYQFYGLEVETDRFSVTLSFSGVRERLVIPFTAITTFADPSVNFALQFQPVDGGPADPPEDVSGEETDDAEPPKRGQVVTLDAFRKK